MYRDYPVEEKSNERVRELAKDLRSSFAIIHENRIDLVASLRQDKIQTCFGLKGLTFEVKAEAELQGDEGMTVFSPGWVSVILSAAVNRCLGFGDPRARSTAAHELAHAVMHEGPPMHRGLRQGSHYSWIPPIKSAEHQTKVFAPAFLIDDNIALEIVDEAEISVIFGVSLVGRREPGEAIAPRIQHS